MDVFLFPSLYEGLGSVLIEAQANGLWCITTKDLVPSDIDVTGRASFIPLQAPSDIWSDAVLSAPERDRSGDSAVKVLLKYDIQRGTDLFERVYSGIR